MSMNIFRYTYCFIKLYIAYILCIYLGSHRNVLHNKTNHNFLLGDIIFPFKIATCSISTRIK